MKLPIHAPVLLFASPLAWGQVPIHEYESPAPHDLFGNSVAGIGDVNGDGHGDFLISAYPARIVRVYSGASGDLLYQVKGKPSDFNNFGFSTDAAGDVNADGIPDFIVGASKNNVNGDYAGRAEVFSGKDGTSLLDLYGQTTQGWFGFAVGGAGDVNADGHDDLVVGAYLDDTVAKDAGAAYVFSGKDGALLHSFFGTQTQDRFGWSVDGAGDVNGDGHADLVVSGPSIHVYSGKDGSTLHHWTHLFANYRGGVSGAGDVNRDGFDDVIIGCAHCTSTAYSAGRVEVRSGVDGSLLLGFDGPKKDAELGRKVAEAGDVDGDGHADILFSTLGAGIKRVQVISGADGSEITRLQGIKSLGLGVAGAGDVNRDGLDDVIMGAPQSDGTLTFGSAYVLLGSLGIVGTTYCSPNVPNSTTLPGNLFASGSKNLTDNTLRLTAQHLPVATMGIVLAGDTQAFVPGAGGSQGNLCLAGRIARVRQTPIVTGASGTFSLLLDLTNVPGYGAILAGETWSFQAWYLDANPGPTSNFTDAVSVTFQ